MICKLFYCYLDTLNIILTWNLINTAIFTCLIMNVLSMAFIKCTVYLVTAGTQMYASYAKNISNHKQRKLIQTKSSWLQKQNESSQRN